MGELERWRAKDLLPGVTFGSRTERSRFNAVVTETRVAQLKVEGSAHVTRQIMERVVDLNRERHELARDDEFLGMVLDEVRVRYARKALNILDDLYTPWG